MWVLSWGVPATVPFGVQSEGSFHCDYSFPLNSSLRLPGSLLKIITLTPSEGFLPYKMFCLFYLLKFSRSNHCFGGAVVS